MKRLILVLCFALCLSLQGLASDGDCRTVRDIAYRSASGDPLIDSMCRLDIYLPADAKGFPTIIWFHGGGLSGGRREIPEALKGHGMAVVGVEYRLVPQVKVADCVADAAARPRGLSNTSPLTGAIRRRSLLPGTRPAAT